MTPQKLISSFLSTFFRKDYMVYNSERIDKVKARICDGVLMTLFVLSIPALISSLLRSSEIGIKPVFFAHTFVAIIIWVTCLAIRVKIDIPYRFRASIVILAFYFIAVTSMLQFGLLAAASGWFIAVPALSVILFNTRVGLIMILVTIISFLVIATLDLNGFISLNVKDDGYQILLLTWINYSITYLLAGGVLFVAVSISKNSLMDSLSKTDSIAKELRQFIETANAPIFGIDSHGHINEWNETSGKITGFKKTDVLGNDLVQTYITEDYREAVKQVLDDALKGKETANFEFPLFTKKGKRVMVLLNSSTRRDATGKIMGVLGVGQDITELVGYRNDLELKVTQRTLKLNEALEKEKELNEIKSRFVSSASHEFRTPLSVINFAAGSMKKYWTEMEPFMLSSKLEKIENQVLHMTKLLDDVLIVGKSEAGEMRNRPLTINLGNFIGEIIEEVYHSSKKGQRIVLIDTEKLKNRDIFIDEKLGRNIFINLISNALKFSPESDKVVVELSSEKDYIIISITDFGIGIPEAELKSIFMPFVRGENVDLIPGTGLGLSIVKEVVNLIGGELVVNSNEGKETTFMVKIPKI
jgi:PAS domain S-box-containing protein